MDVVGAEELWFGLPAGGGEPSLHGSRQSVCGGGEFAGDDGSVSADSAGDVENALVGLAVAAMPASDQLAGMVGIAVEPGDREIGALVSGLFTRGRLVATRWAGASRFRGGQRCGGNRSVRGRHWGLGHQSDCGRAILGGGRRYCDAFSEVAVDGGAGHVQDAGNLSDGVLSRVVETLRQLRLVGGEFGGPPTLASAGSGRGQTGAYR